MLRITKNFIDKYINILHLDIQVIVRILALLRLHLIPHRFEHPCFHQSDHPICGLKFNINNDPTMCPMISLQMRPSHPCPTNETSKRWSISHSIQAMEALHSPYTCISALSRSQLPPSSPRVPSRNNLPSFQPKFDRSGCAILQVSTNGRTNKLSTIASITNTNTSGKKATIPMIWRKEICPISWAQLTKAQDTPDVQMHNQGKKEKWRCIWAQGQIPPPDSNLQGPIDALPPPRNGGG